MTIDAALELFMFYLPTIVSIVTTIGVLIKAVDSIKWNKADNAKLEKQMHRMQLETEKYMKENANLRDLVLKVLYKTDNNVRPNEKTKE